MEFADNALITGLIQKQHRMAARPPRGVSLGDSRPSSRVQRCTCGVCPRCVDNARWDRNFQEKFADPDYYRERGPRRESTLSEL